VTVLSAIRSPGDALITSIAARLSVPMLRVIVLRMIAPGRARGIFYARRQRTSTRRSRSGMLGVGWQVTSDARVTQLIEQHFLTEWPAVAIGVPGRVGDPPAPSGSSCAHLSVWIGETRRGWIYVRLWVPVPLQITGTIVLVEAARHVFGGRRIVTDDGAIEIDHGERFDVGRDGAWWMSAAVFSFRIV
jgi:hypothetical protein